ncbi:methyltransferase domain-containing protein [Candidatus Gracilibacteria bacterium]|nr:methyltransferase domain-containing protein [Candidatus Gracilibacteria bacterium]
MNNNLICDVNNYIFTKINEDRKIKFKELFGEIKGGRGLDLGSGFTGIYWLLSYVEKIESIDYFDYFDNNIKKLEEILNNISPEYLNENFSDTINFLEEEKFIQKNSEELCINIIEKVGEIKQFNFFNEINNGNNGDYDFIISSEAIECVENYEDFKKVVKNIYNGLNIGGLFIGNILEYKERNSITDDLIKNKQEGKLNPSIKTIKKAFLEIGFEIKKLKLIKNNRGNLIYFVGKK